MSQATGSGTAGNSTAGSATTGGDRRRTVLATLVLGGLILLVGTAVWVRASTSSAVQADVALSVTGTVVAPAVNAGGLVLLAAGCALALGGRWGRVLAAGGVVLGGLLVAASAVAAVGGAQAAAVSAAREVVGVGTLDGPASTTPLPWVAVVLGAAAVVLGVRTVVVSPGWVMVSSRHDSPASSGGRPGAWEDGPTASDDPVQAGPPDPAQQPDAQDTWDALTRGDDPT